MSIYTRKGDSGETSLLDKRRVKKSHQIVETIGTIDELNGHIGLSVTLLDKKVFKDLIVDLLIIQNRLFYIGSHLASENLLEPTFNLPNENDIFKLEKSIDKHDSELPELKNFILPGGTKEAAELQIARSVCRRAERNYFRLEAAPIQGKYLNRLSDFLFSSARLVNHRLKVQDTIWTSKTN